MWMIIFLVLPLAGISYVLWHLYNLLPLPQAGRWAVVAAALLAFSCMFVSFFRRIDSMPIDLGTAVYETGFSSLFVLLYLTIIFLVLDLGRTVHLVPKAWLHGNAIVSVAIAALLVGLFTYGYLNYRDKRRIPIALSTTKSLSREVKVVMMSDLHLGYHNRRAEVQRWVEMVNAEQADLILIAGDIIDMSMRPLIEEDLASVLRQLNAPAYACMGNHEYISGRGEALRFLHEAGIQVLRDSVAIAGDIAIIGRDDRSNRQRKSVAELMKGIDRRKYTILMDHQPYHLEEAQQAGVDFQLSGHTHHGQLWPISWITESVYECAAGEWQRGKTRYFISSGMGIWGAKFRIGTHSDYAVVTIGR